MLVRLAFLLLLIAPPIALAADAPSAGGGKITVVPQPPPKAAAAPAPTSGPLPPLAAASPAPQAASDCRMDCAQSHYLCRASEQGDGCDGRWSQCVAACNSPNLAQPFSTAP